MSKYKFYDYYLLQNVENRKGWNLKVIIIVNKLKLTRKK